MPNEDIEDSYYSWKQNRCIELGIHTKLNSKKVITIQEASDIVENAYRSIYCRTSDKGFSISIKIYGSLYLIEEKFEYYRRKYNDEENIERVTNLKNLNKLVYCCPNLPILSLSLSVGTKIEKYKMITMEYNRNIDMKYLFQIKSLFREKHNLNKYTKQAIKNLPSIFDCKIKIQIIIINEKLVKTVLIMKTEDDEYFIINKPNREEWNNVYEGQFLVVIRSLYISNGKSYGFLTIVK